MSALLARLAQFMRQVTHRSALVTCEHTRQECRLPDTTLEALIRPLDDSPAARQALQERCTICLDEWAEHPWDEANVDLWPVQPRICAHVFHRGCIRNWVLSHRSCPLCRCQLAVFNGFQPPGGTFRVVRFADRPLPGFETCGRLVVTMALPDGIQDLEDPLPGEPYTGTHLETYLPDNSEGMLVARMLALAWRRGLMFRVNLNTETGRCSQLMLNGWELKTQTDGGYVNNGFPDDSYLSRLKADLADLGITSAHVPDEPL